MTKRPSAWMYWQKCFTDWKPSPPEYISSGRDREGTSKFMQWKGFIVTCTHVKQIADGKAYPRAQWTEFQIVATASFMNAWKHKIIRTLNITNESNTYPCAVFGGRGSLVWLIHRHGCHQSLLSELNENNNQHIERCLLSLLKITAVWTRV